MREFLGNSAVHYAGVQQLATTAQRVGDLLVSSLVIYWRVSGSDIALICKYRIVITYNYKS